jgi:hypothetical protein
MNTVGKVVSASVLVGSAIVGVGAIRTISAGISNKKGATIALGVLTLLIGVYAFKEAVQKINE